MMSWCFHICRELIDTIRIVVKLSVKEDRSRIGEPRADQLVVDAGICGCSSPRTDFRLCLERTVCHVLQASHLAAHAVVQLKTEDALVVVKEFDATAKGSKNSNQSPLGTGRRRHPCGRRDT